MGLNDGETWRARKSCEELVDFIRVRGLSPGATLLSNTQKQSSKSSFAKQQFWRKMFITSNLCQGKRYSSLHRA